LCSSSSPDPQSDPFQILPALQTQLNVPFFMDIIIILSWSIWTSRKKLIFEGQQPGIPSVKEIFNREFALVILRAKQSCRSSITQWLNSAL
jgi:hypothetical protein